MYSCENNNIDYIFGSLCDETKDNILWPLITYRGQDKMASILYNTLWNCFLYMTIVVFWYKFY